jgi:hypothetical protein
MRVKTTAAGSPVYDMDDLGDPFAPKGEHLHDRPALDAVNKDLQQMDNQFGDLHLDLGVEPVRLEGSAAEDLRHNLERQYRDRVVVGNYDCPEAMFADGAIMPQRMEDALRYSSGETRELVAQREHATDAMLREYQVRNPDLAQDLDGMSAAIDVAMEFYAENGESPLADPNRFLKDVAYYHRSGVRSQRQSSADHGRTAGISSGAPAARADGQEQKGDLVEELQAIQRRSGFW